MGKYIKKFSFNIIEQTICIDTQIQYVYMCA